MMYGSIESDATEAAPTSRRRTRLLALVVAAAALAGAAQMKNDVYCTLGGPPTEFIVKYQNIGGTMTCSTKWRRSFSVVCGDACAWTEDAFWGSDAGARLGPGLAAIICAMIFF